MIARSGEVSALGREERLRKAATIARNSNREVLVALIFSLLAEDRLSYGSADHLLDKIARDARREADTYGP